MTQQKKYTFFYSGRSPFSNWHGCTFEMEDVEFNCAEQAMMYYKALLFDDDAAADKVMVAKTPREQKTLGRSVRNFDQSVWEENRERIMYDILFAKFSQNDDLKEALLRTEGTRCVESAPNDRVWGVGLSEDDPRIQDEAQWQGMNLLGKTLDRVREALYV